MLLLIARLNATPCPFTPSKLPTRRWPAGPLCPLCPGKAAFSHCAFEVTNIDDVFIGGSMAWHGMAWHGMVVHAGGKHSWWCMVA
jgi:hypothetical protein